jgi:hypothetical protein
MNGQSPLRRLPHFGGYEMLRRTLLVLLVGAPVLARPAFAQSDLVAIDVLIEPDETMIASAQAWNARLREQVPDGFALDATHAPHITLLQTYVAADELDAVLASVGEASAGFDVAELRMKAIGLYDAPIGGQGVQGIVIEPSPELLAIQAAMIAAIAPFRRSGGGEGAFAPDPSGAAFQPALFEYVDTFIERLAGPHYNPHVSTGVGPRDWLDARAAEPFAGFEFGAKDIAVWRLGNFGTAAERLAGF